MLRYLFLDRDGTILVEPQPDQQVDSLAKFQFLPGVIRNLALLARETDFRFVLATNQDGLGTTAFPEATFWPWQQLMVDILATEGVRFDAIHIDRSYPHENLPTRKPGTAMLTAYFDPARCDLSRSFVIGDRLTDLELAQNLGCQAILLRPEVVPGAILTTLDWDTIRRFLCEVPRVGAA